VNVNSTIGTNGSGALNGAPATTTTTSAERTLGQDAFLKLLITQLENQDPTNPKQDTEFIAQLAVFSQLEKLTEISASLKLLTEQLTVASTGETDGAVTPPTGA
jgi:flagellar basal-body rod modification protein FlgD